MHLQQLELPLRAVHCCLGCVSARTPPGRVVNTWLGLLAAAGCEVAVWRPTDLDTVTAALGPRQTRLADWSTP